jgi:hypothetical protein
VRQDCAVTTCARITRGVAVAAMAGCVVFLSGCVKVDYKVSTSVGANGRCEREMKMEAQGDLLRYVNMTDMRSRLQSGNWRVDQHKWGNEVSIALSKKFDSVQKMAEEALGTMPIGIPLLEDSDVLQPGRADLKVRNLFFVAYYRYTETTPKIALKLKRGPVAISIRKLVGRLMKAKVALTLPGQITKTNGKLQGASTATWNLTLPDYLDGYTMTAESKIVHIWAFAVVGVGILALILILVTLTRGRGKTSAEAEHGGEAGYGE